MQQPKFHLAIPVDDLETCRSFYGDVLGFGEGRSSTRWVDFDMYGHQLVIHQVDAPQHSAATNPVDGSDVPVPHFGAVLSVEDWKDLAERLQGCGVDFVIEPQLRFEGEVGEQHTMFFLDPSNNALEFKALTNPEHLFQA